MKNSAVILAACVFVAVFAAVARAGGIWQGKAAEVSRSQERGSVGTSPQELQHFVCTLYAADKHQMQALAVDALPRIGGWFSIQFYRELLSPAALNKYRMARRGEVSRETATTEPAYWSLVSLPKVVPNPPPLPAPDSSFDAATVRQNAQIWRDWIRTNEPTLKTLQPTGSGLDFTGAHCSFRRALPALAPQP